MSIVYSLMDYTDVVLEDKNKYHKSFRIQLDGIMKKLFNLKNKVPIIDFLNAAYKDNISYDAKIIYGDKEISNFNKSKKLINFFADMYIHVEDGVNVYDYEIEFQTKYEKGLILRMFRYGYERAVKLVDYDNFKSNSIEINIPEPYIIVIEEEDNIPDALNLNINIPKGLKFTYKCDILKYYEKSIEELKDNNMYLLLPVYIVRLRKDMEKLDKRKNVNEKEIKYIVDELMIESKNILNTMDVLYNKNKITLEDYDDMVTVMSNIVSYFENRYEQFIGIEEEVGTMFKSFYDPKVEERGIEKGIERGIERGIEDGIVKGKIKTAENLLKMGMIIEQVAKATELPVEKIIEIKKKMEN